MEKVATIQSGYKDMKYNFERELETIQDHMRVVEDKIGELHKKYANLEAADLLPGPMTVNYNLAPSPQKNVNVTPGFFPKPEQTRTSA